MKLYHGSNQEIIEIDLAKCKRYKDFGQGFYTTHIHSQAEHWAKRIADRFGGNPTIMEYDFDMDGAINDGLNIKRFNHPDLEWAEFVMANRKVSDVEFHHNYDIVIGPVADDNMARLFGLYDMEIIDLETVVAGLVCSTPHFSDSWQGELSNVHLARQVA